jgi:hypothetical protein
MTDMCLSGGHVADMLADMLATRTASVRPTCHLPTCQLCVGGMLDVGMAKRGSK